MPIQTTGTRALFTDDLGRPLVGGKVYTYAVGTSLPKDTYKNPNLTVPNNNPIILDDAGSADIYLKDGYRIRVFSSNGVFIDEQNNVFQGVNEFSVIPPGSANVEQIQSSIDNLNTKRFIETDVSNRAKGYGNSTGDSFDFSIRADKLRIAEPSSTKMGELLFKVYEGAQIVNDVSVPSGVYLEPGFIAKESITGDKIARGTELNKPKLTATYAETTTATANLTLDSEGNLKRSTSTSTGVLQKTFTGNASNKGIILSTELPANSILSATLLAKTTTTNEWRQNSSSDGFTIMNSIIRRDVSRIEFVCAGSLLASNFEYIIVVTYQPPGA